MKNDLIINRLRSSIGGQLSFVHPHQISVHLDSIDVPDHFGLCEGSDSSQVFEESCRHFLVKFTQIRLNFTFSLFNDFHDVFGVFRHHLFKLKLLLDVSLLMKLNIAGLKEMGIDCNVSFNLSFSHDPFRYPLSCHKVIELHIFTCDSDVNV